MENASPTNHHENSRAKSSLSGDESPATVRSLQFEDSGCEMIRPCFISFHVVQFHSLLPPDTTIFCEVSEAKATDIPPVKTQSTTSKREGSNQFRTAKWDKSLEVNSTIRSLAGYFKPKDYKIKIKEVTYGVNLDKMYTRTLSKGTLEVARLCNSSAAFSSHGIELKLEGGLCYGILEVNVTVNWDEKSMTRVSSSESLSAALSSVSSVSRKVSAAVSDTLLDFLDQPRFPSLANNPLSSRSTEEKIDEDVFKKHFEDTPRVRVLSSCSKALSCW